LRWARQFILPRSRGLCLWISAPARHPASSQPNPADFRGGCMNRADAIPPFGYYRTPHFPAARSLPLHMPRSMTCLGPTVAVPVSTTQSAPSARADENSKGEVAKAVEAAIRVSPTSTHPPPQCGDSTTTPFHTCNNSVLRVLHASPPRTDMHARLDTATSTAHGHTVSSVLSWLCRDLDAENRRRAPEDQV